MELRWCDTEHVSQGFTYLRRTEGRAADLQDLVDDEERRHTHYNVAHAQQFRPRRHVCKIVVMSPV